MNRTLTTQYGRALIQPATLSRENRTVDVVFATETPVPRSNWDEDYDEVLLCAPESVRMDRISHGLPVVDTHNTRSVLSQFGRTEKVWFSPQTREIWATVKFSQRSGVETLLQDIADGILADISVGYRVYKFEREPQAEGQRPVYRAVDWMPVEISLCAVPADINSGTRAATSADSNQVTITNNPNMDNQNVTTPAPPPAPDIENIRAAATAAERARLNAILTSVRAAALPDSYGIELYTSDRTVEDCRQEIIVKAAAKQTPPPDGAHAASVGAEAADKKRAAIEGVILNRVAPSSFKLDEAARPWRGMSLVEIARELLSERGANIRGLDKTGVSQMVFGTRSHTTSDFPVLFGNVIDRMLRADYGFAPEFWSLIARQTSVSDFREKALYQVETENGMREMAEGAEIKYTTLKEGKQSIRVKSYAEGILFTRQAFINDDLGAFSIIPQRFVKDWDEKRGDLVWSLITDNVKMGDGKNLYSADHNNLITGSASALSEAGLTAAMVKAKKQTGLDGKRRIRVEPKFLIVPAELEVQARKLMTAIAASTISEVNVFNNKFTIIVEPRLTDPSEWFLLSDPAAADTILYAYLDGQEALRVATEDDFNTDSMKYAVRGEFGATAIDHRGTVKSAGK